MADPAVLEVEVVDATAAVPALVRLSLPRHSTVRDALAAADLQVCRGEFDPGRVGIFGKLVRLDTVLQAHDRVEIYRLLAADPKEARRQRAAAGRKNKSG